jgi:hypothetical protein
MPGIRGRRIHHFWALAATGLLLLAAPPMAQGVRAQTAASEGTGGFVQTGVPAEATAENAVVARERALASAQRIAYDRMAGEMGLPKGADAATIERLVESVIIEQEHTTRNGYSGRVTVRFAANRVRPGSGGGGSGGDAAGGTAASPPPGGEVAMPASAYLDTVAQFGSLPEWLDLRRRLGANPVVASVEVQAIAVDGARLRLGLRTVPAQAASELARSGVALAPAGPVPGQMAAPVPAGYAPAPAAGGAWRVGLARGF